MNVPVRTVAAYLDELHYLGAAKRGTAWSDEFGVLVLAKPTSRRLPQDGTWLELTRWCLTGEKNGGSRQWKTVVRWIKETMPNVTTVVSYSDPSAGHTGALYKACNWLWAPTWHRLRPPPSGNGAWAEGASESVKDRWIYPLRRDERRVDLLSVKDESIMRSLDGAVRAKLTFIAPEDGTPDHPRAVDAPPRKPMRKSHWASVAQVGA